MARPVKFNSGSTGFNFGANTVRKPRKAIGGTSKKGASRRAQSAKGGGS